MALGEENGELRIVERSRLELVEPSESVWSKQPYHAAEHLPRDEAGVLVDRAVSAAYRNALRAMEEPVQRMRSLKHTVTGCAVLIGEPMPEWTTDEILNLHFRMHKAEGNLFRSALLYAAESCRLRVFAIPEKRLDEYAQATIGELIEEPRDRLASLGKKIGPPWGADQKDGALAALIALLG